MRELAVVQGFITPTSFLLGYRKFAEHSAAIGFIRYEDFARDPTTQMHALCDHLQVNFDPRFLQRWFTYTRITGDRKGEARGQPLRTIQPLERRACDEELQATFRSQPDYHKSLELLGYSDNAC